MLVSVHVPSKVKWFANKNLHLIKNAEYCAVQSWLNELWAGRHVYMCVCVGMCVYICMYVCVFNETPLKLWTK